MNLIESAAVGWFSAKSGQLETLKTLNPVYPISCAAAADAAAGLAYYLQTYLEKIRAVTARREAGVMVDGAAGWFQPREAGVSCPAENFDQLSAASLTALRNDLV